MWPEGPTGNTGVLLALGKPHGFRVWSQGWSLVQRTQGRCGVRDPGTG